MRMKPLNVLARPWTQPIRTPRFAANADSPPSLGTDDVDRLAKHRFERKGVRENQDRLAKGAWKNCWNLPLMIMLAGVGYLGYGRAQALWRGPDVSKYSQESVQMNEKLKAYGVTDFSDRHGTFVMKEILGQNEAFQKLDPAVREKLNQQLTSVLKESGDLRTDQSFHGFMNVMGLVFLSAVGLILLCGIGSRFAEEDDQTFNVLKRLILLPKSLMDGLRLRRFEIQELSHDDLKRFGPIMRTAGEKALEIQTRLDSLWETQPALREEVKNAYGSLPTAEALLQGYLYKTLDAAATESLNAAPGTRIINLTEVVQTTVGLMEDSLETGYLLTGLIPEDQKIVDAFKHRKNKSSDENTRLAEAEERLRHAQLLNHSLSQQLNTVRLQALEIELAEVERELTEACQEMGHVQKIANLQAQQAALHAQSKNLTGYINTVRLQALKIELAEVERELTEARMGPVQKIANLQAQQAALHAQSKNLTGYINLAQHFKLEISKQLADQKILTVSTRPDSMARVLAMAGGDVTLSGSELELLMAQSPTATLGLEAGEALRVKLQADELLRNLAETSELKDKSLTV